MTPSTVTMDQVLACLDITSENLKEVLEGLITGVDNLDEVEASGSGLA